jgi:Tfp pilus assembly protein PilF
MTTDLYKNFFHFFLLATIITICYSGTLQNSWHFDDFPNIVDNKNVHIDNLSWVEIKKSFYSQITGNVSRPLANLSFAINYLFFGLDPTSYNIVNIVIHIICTIFVYLVFVITLKISQKENINFQPDYHLQDIALLGAVYWAIHPIQTQAVTYIVQRMASMAAMFYMISMYCYLICRIHKGRKKKTLFFILCILFWMAGIMSKENAALLPLGIIAYEIVIFRISLKNNLKFQALFYGSIVALIIISFYFISGDIFEYFEKSYAVRTYTVWQRLITEPIIIIRYIILLFIPVADFLSLESDILASRGLLSPPVTILANITILILITISIYFFKKYPLICFSIFFYFINHLIESTIIGLELYFEHRNYLPSIFIYLSISYIFYRILLFYEIRNKKTMYSLFIFFIIFVLICEGNASYLRNEVWKNEISLNLDNISKAPKNLRGYNNLSAEYIKLGEIDKANEYLRQAEFLYNKNPEIYQKYGIADIYLNAGLIQLHGQENIEKAVQLLMKSVDFDPYDYNTHFQLAIAFFKLNDIANAETAIFNAVQLKDDQARIYNLWGRILFASNKYDLAIKVLNKGLEFEKRRELYLNLVASYLAIGEKQRARSVFFFLDDDESDDLLYNLYKLLVSSESEKEKILSIIVSFITKKQINFCDWISEINDNKHLSIIFPDISYFYEDLSQTYIISLNNKISDKQNNINIINNSCK